MLVVVLIFILVPLAELYVIIQVGNAIGLIPTLVLLLLDALLGSMLLRHQGRAAWIQFNRALAENRLPHKEVFDGILVILGGALLLSPGFITDIFGLVPADPADAGDRARHLVAHRPQADGDGRHALDHGPRRAASAAAARARRRRAVEPAAARPRLRITPSAGRNRPSVPPAAGALTTSRARGRRFATRTSSHLAGSPSADERRRARGFVCGFGDVQAGLGGLAWDLGEPGALLLSKGEVRQASFAIEHDLEPARRDHRGARHGRGDPRAPADADRTSQRREPGGFKATASLAEVRPKGGGQTVECAGQISEWIGDPLEGAGVLRHLAVGGAPGSLLIAIARGLPGGDGHGSERAGGWLLSGDSGVPYEETLISTQYDGAGDPTRLGLELWPEDADQSSRAGATRVSGTLLGGFAAGAFWAGLFRCHTDGAEGLGSYLLWRA